MINRDKSPIKALVLEQAETCGFTWQWRKSAAILSKSAPMRVTEREMEHGWREPNKAPQAQKNQEKYSSGLQF